MRLRLTSGRAKYITVTYQAKAKKTWSEFRKEYVTKIVARFDGKSKQAILDTLMVFERVAKPKLVASITTDMVDQFTAKRLEGHGIKGRTISPATVNKDLRYIRAMMRVAQDWGYVANVPKLRFLKTNTKLPTYVSAKHFAAIYTPRGLK